MNTHLRLSYFVCLALAVATAVGLAQNGTAAQTRLEDAGAAVNRPLQAAGRNIRLATVETYTAEAEAGQTTYFFHVGNKQLPDHFIPGDPRRFGWSGLPGATDDITWSSDSSSQGDSGISRGPTQSAIDRAMSTWQNATCSDLLLTKVPNGGDIGVVEFLVTGGASGSLEVAADVQHTGFATPLDAILLPQPIIAATFTFVFIDDAGNPTDIDNNGKADVAFQEIYYTGHYPWGINSNNNIDIETVALHEAGHALSQAHFGRLFRTERNGRFHFSPRAVMNAGYTGIQQSLTATDLGGHCSIWASWPNR